MNIKNLVLSSFLTLPILCSAHDDRVIIIIPGSASQGGPEIFRPHAPARPIAIGYYDLESQELALQFENNIGNCIVTVTSASGGYYQENFDTATLFFTTTIPYYADLYVITIEDCDGAIYSTQFVLV